MDLGDILSKDQIITDLRASNRWEAIDELIDNLVATGKIKTEDREAIAAVVKKRESSMSTGIGFGIGIPHASTDLIFEVVGALGRSRQGVDFDALDNQRVNLVMLFLVPHSIIFSLDSCDATFFNPVWMVTNPIRMDSEISIMATR